MLLLKEFFDRLGNLKHAETTLGYEVANSHRSTYTLILGVLRKFVGAKNEQVVLFSFILALIR